MELCLDYKKIYLDDAETVSIELEPLGTNDQQKVIGFISGGMSEDPSKNILTMSQPELIRLAELILPKYFKNLKGVTLKKDGEKRDGTIEDLLKYGTFIPYITRALVQIMIDSALNLTAKEEVKKL